VALLESPVVLKVNNLTRGVQVTVPVRMVEEGSAPNCTYLNETGRFWVTEGCSFNETQPYAVVCICNHLTQFSAQESGEGLLEAYSSANVEEATNFSSITDLEFWSKAIGFYVALFAANAVCRAFSPSLQS
jgi:hypothetical protein